MFHFVISYTFGTHLGETGHFALNTSSTKIHNVVIQKLDQPRA